MFRALAISVIAAAIGGMVGCAFAVYQGAPMYWLAGVPIFPILGFVIAISIFERWVDR